MLEGTLRLVTVEGTGRQFVAQTAAGHAVVMDDGVGKTAPRPIDYVLLALGGCTAFDVIGILRKKRQPVTRYEIEVKAEQNKEPPTVFTRVEIKHRLWGEIDPETVKTAIRLSETKYCSVGAMLGKTAQIEASFEILPARDAGKASEANF